MSLPDPRPLSIRQFMHDSGEHARPMHIPRYQREYSWEREEVKLLLDDIKNAMDGEAPSPYYFIGSILCIKRGEGESAYHEIVDGQQRVATLSMIFAVVLHYIRNNPPSAKELGIDPDEFSRVLENVLYYGGRLLDGSISERPYRLDLSDGDNMLYRQFIKSGPVQKRNGRPQRFHAVYNTILSFIEGEAEGTGAGTIREFVSFILENVYIIGIFVDSDVDAYEVFEVMNDRNKELTSIDLIKNKLLSCFGENTEALNDAYGQWRAVDENCGSLDLMQEYVRCMLQMEAGHKIEPKGLYRHLRDKLTRDPKIAKKKAKSFLDDLYNHAHKFSALQRRDAAVWADFDPNIKPLIAYLKQFKVVRTLMFAVMYAKTKPDFVLDIAHIMERFIKRSRAVQERFSVMEHYEQEFARMARDIRKRNENAPKNSTEFLDRIKEIDAKGRNVIPDESFIALMSERGFKGAYARTVLSELSNYYQGKVDTVANEDVVTLEHVLPQTPEISEWPGFQDKEHASAYVGRLGNLALLEGGKNTGISNKKFSEKQKLAYSKSGILLTRELNEKYPEWTPDTVKKRSKKLAKLAAELWSFKGFEKKPE